MSTSGYGVVCNGTIDTKTIGPTIRSAMVNWLWLKGIAILARHTDEDIRRKWLLYKGPDAEIHKVSVRVVKHGIVDASMGKIS